MRTCDIKNIVFYRLSMVASAVWNFMVARSATNSSRTGCWHIEILRDTAVYDFGEDLFFRFSEWRIPEVMPHLLAISEKYAILPGSRFRELDDVFAAKKYAMF